LRSREPSLPPTRAETHLRPTINDRARPIHAP
jgi:hypothetical protein